MLRPFILTPLGTVMKRPAVLVIPGRAISGNPLAAMTWMNSGYSVASS